MQREAKAGKKSNVESKGFWHQSGLELLDGEYHIVHGGILTRSDYSLLFEGEGGKRHLPIEATGQINVYADVEVSASALRLMSKRGVKVAYFDGAGRLQGVYRPAEDMVSGDLVLEQCSVYSDAPARLAYAKEFERAGFVNMRANLCYYAKRGNQTLKWAAGELSRMADRLDGCKDIGSVMLLEARARSTYYSAFDAIVAGSGFCFGRRTKRPPENEMNAMVSFGNAMLYNKLLQIIQKTRLDARIGIVHATNNRPASLHLDFADIFKPLVVDRAIFALVNRHEIKRHEHFKREGVAVLLNDKGRRILVEKIEDKFGTEITVAGDKMTYEQLMHYEVDRYQNTLEEGELYQPLKLR